MPSLRHASLSWPLMHGDSADACRNIENDGPNANVVADEKGAKLSIPVTAEPKLSSRMKEQLSGFDCLSQVFPPFLVAGLGMVVAGMLLSTVRKWAVFLDVRALMVLVPALLGLKGNLEMTLASRLATHANLGDLDVGDTLVSIVVGNLALVQCQSAVVGTLASMVAHAMSWVEQEDVSMKHFLLLSSSSVLAASLASLVLSSMMIMLVLAAYRGGIDPDNVASPIAGMLGDCCTLGLLAVIAQTFWQMQEEWWWLQVAVLVFYVAFVPICARAAKSCRHTSAILLEGWTPIIVSMLISSLGGLILKHAVKNFPGLSRFAPVMNGAGGNLAAVQASRISTELHGSSRRECKEAADDQLSYCCNSLLGQSPSARTARVLILISIPGSFIFVTMISFLSFGTNAVWPGPAFLLAYALATLAQVCLLMTISHNVVHRLWRLGVDPDNAAIPYITSLGDLLGSASLTLAFWILSLIGCNPFVSLLPAISNSR